MIYIQSNSERTLAHHFDCSCALYGAIDSGRDYRLTTFDEVASGKFDALIKGHLFVGSTDFMKEVFKRIGLENVRLPQNSNREYETITLSQARERVSNGRDLFIKPVEIKLFTGFVLDRMIYGCLEGLPDDTEVMAYEPFKEPIESEWRIYVRNHQMIDSRNYSGKFYVNPDYGYVTKVLTVNESRNFPRAYVIDIGILASKENIVIEFNDMWAIGNYGIPNDLYLRALEERYYQIVNPPYHEKFQI